MPQIKYLNFVKKGSGNTTTVFDRENFNFFRSNIFIIILKKLTISLNKFLMEDLINLQNKSTKSPILIKTCTIKKMIFLII